MGLAQNVLFLATVTDELCERIAALPSGWKAAPTADPTYPITDAQIAKLREGGRTLHCWGSAYQLGLDRVKAFGTQVGAKRIFVQAENPPEYESAPPNWFLIGDPNGWYPANLADAITRGRTVVCEVYTGRPDTYSSRGVPPAGFCFWIGGSSDQKILLSQLELCPAGFRRSFSLFDPSTLDEDGWTVLSLLG